MNTKEFILEARALHGNAFDYSQAVYTGAMNKLAIICPLHGLFYQTPNGHLRRSGYGCTDCGLEVKHYKGRAQLAATKKSTEQFVDEVKQVHGERYGYNNIDYQGARKPVSLTCSIHGEFSIIATNLLKGCGCWHCSIQERTENRRKTVGYGQNALTFEAFLKKARQKHGLRFNYSKAEYTSAKNKITIICKEHGEFSQEPSSHLAGRGCRECGIATRAATRRTAPAFMSQEQFIKDCVLRHGRRYDYSDTNYTRATGRIAVICRIHGAYTTVASDHRNGKGNCLECNAIKRTRAAIKAMTVWDSETFITACQKFHPTQDFTRVKFVDMNTPVTVICPVHGARQVVAQRLIRKGKCRECYIDRLRGSIRTGRTEYIRRFAIKHGAKYDYSLVPDKVAHNDKIPVICPKHGVFEIEATVHAVHGTGCKKCTDEQRRDGWVAQANGSKGILYFLRVFNEQEEFFKVGITFRSIAYRFYGQRSLAGYQYEVLAEYKSTNAAAVYDWEQSILETFAYISYTPKQYFAGQSECFSSCNEILEIFPL